MRNFTRWTAVTLLGLATFLGVGCDSGTEIPEGVPEDGAEQSDAAYEQFKQMQQNTGSTAKELDGGSKAKKK